MYERTYGPKYHDLGEHPSAAEIAKAIRADFKAAKAAGEFPERITFQVKSETFAGGCAVNVYIVGFGTAWTYNDLTRRETMTDEAVEIYRKVEAIREAYNHDGSEPMTDYFDVRYYGKTEFGARWGTKAWERERAEAALH